MDFERKVGPKGQVVIPRDIRRITGVRPNSEVFISLEGDTILVKKHKVKLSDILREQVKKDGKYLSKIDSDKEYEEMIEERFKKK